MRNGVKDVGRKIKVGAVCLGAAGSTLLLFGGLLLIVTGRHLVIPLLLLLMGIPLLLYLSLLLFGFGELIERVQSIDRKLRVESDRTRRAGDEEAPLLEEEFFLTK